MAPSCCKIIDIHMNLRLQHGLKQWTMHSKVASRGQQEVFQQKQTMEVFQAGSIQKMICSLSWTSCCCSEPWQLCSWRHARVGGRGEAESSARPYLATTCSPPTAGLSHCSHHYSSSTSAPSPPLTHCSIALFHLCVEYLFIIVTLETVT